MGVDAMQVTQTRNNSPWTDLFVCESIIFQSPEYKVKYWSRELA